MVSTGNLNFVNGSPTLSGQFSGFDTNAIIEATLLAKRLPAVRLESTIKDNDLQSTAYTELTTLLANLQTASSALRNPPGLSGTDSNIFETKAAFLTSGNATSAGTLVGVSATNAAAAGTYELEILRLATANKTSSGAVADSTAAQNVADTITIGLVGETTKDIVIEATDTLDEIAAAINAVKGDTNVRAAVIKVADNDFRLVLTAEETGKAITLSGASGQFLTTFGDGAVLSELDPAQTSQIKIDGIATIIERTTNDVSDVVSGVTFQLYKADVGNNIKVEIQNNLATIKEKISDFVQAYNEVRDLVTSQRSYDPQSANAVKPILYGDDILRRVEQSLYGNISTGALGLSATAFNNFAAIGIDIDSENKLTLNDSELDDALVSNLDQLRAVFEFGVTSDTTNFRIISRSNALNIDDFELVISGVDAGGQITGATVTGQGSVFDISGSTLTGKVGTAFEGAVFVYAGAASSGAKTIQVQTSLGIAESIFQTLENFLEPGGIIPTRLADITDENKSLSTKITDIDSRLAVTRLFLLNKYARLEQSLGQAEAMKKQLEAMANASK
ncbi:MAG: flagellar filament capping protein FliD [Halopseudomonas aestusnigri]